MKKMITYCFFFFNDPATTEIYTLALHDALPIYKKEIESVSHQLCGFTAHAVHTDPVQQMLILIPAASDAGVRAK